MTSESARLFIATERLDSSDGEKWATYCQWAKIPELKEVVSLDCMLCRHLLADASQRLDEDWKHIVCEDFRLDHGPRHSEARERAAWLRRELRFHGVISPDPNSGRARQGSP